MLTWKKRPDINQFISGEPESKVVQVPKNIHEDPIWRSLCKVFTLCTQVEPVSRPSTGDILEMLGKIEMGQEISRSER